MKLCGVAISNVLSLLTCFLELMFYSGTVWGFSFLEYIFKEEKIFEKEKCDNVDPSDYDNLCEDALKFYNLIFTCSLISSTIGSVAFGFLEVRYGHFLTRCIANSLTSFGLVALCFYRSSGYCIMVSWVLMACSAVYYIGSNSSLVPFFGTFAGLAMMLICGIFDMSAALFLLFKLAWQNYDADLQTMLIGLTAGSIIIWVRTFFFMPVGTMDYSRSVYEQSFFGQCGQKSSKDTDAVSIEDKSEEVEKPEEKREDDDSKSVMKVLKTLNTWSYCAFYCIGCTRIKSIQGWIYPWMEWTYSTVPDSKDLISQQLDIYGYLYLASPLIGAVPGILSVLIEKLTKSAFSAKFYTLLILMTLATTINIISSLQMCHQAEGFDDTGNTITFMVLFTLVKTWFFATPVQFIYTFYPIELMSVMYGIFAMPLIILQWVIDPLFKLILNGPDLGDAEFCPVQIGFAVALGVTSLSIAYTAVCGCRRLNEEIKPEPEGDKEKQNEEESGIRNSAYKSEKHLTDDL